MEEMIKNPFDLFADVQETYEEAVKKSAEESKSFAKTKYFKMDSPGTYSVRILPLAPVLQEDGTYALDRKGYEYPTKTQILKLTNPNPKSKKDQQLYATVTHSSFAGISTDLIDTYIEVAEEKYGDDEKLIKKIKGTGFEGGLKWNSQRVMYVYDLKKRSEGIQMLSLSYSQYKDLEERKLAIWKKLQEKSDNKVPCPVSSVNGAYPVEIVRKEENKKTSYTFNVDVLSDTKPLEEEEIKTLLDTARIPEVLYRYSRYQLEATIEFLKQYDEKNEMDVMNSKKIAEAIEKIKMELPADDKSHFSFDKKDRNAGDSQDGTEENTIDSLWNRWEDLKERGIGDKSDEGQELRDDIRAFIDDNNLSVRVLRSKTNEDLLGDIEDALETQKGEDKADTDEETAEEQVSEEKEEVNPEETTPEAQEAEEEEPKSERGEHNDDTNEPALGRRTSRPIRRRTR